MLFNKVKSNTFMYVIFRVMFRIRQWPMLHRKEKRPLFMKGCRRWEALLLAVFAKFSRNFSITLKLSSLLCLLRLLAGSNLVFLFLVVE